MAHGHGDKPLDVLAHEAEPGYPRAFWIAFAVGSIYLAVVLIAAFTSGEAHP